MAVKIITGTRLENNVQSDDDGARIYGTVSTGDRVLNVGEIFDYEIISNNCVRIKSGEILMQGRHVRQVPGTYTDLTIDNGTQGQKRNDIIVMRYTKNAGSGLEDAELDVIKGTPGDTAVDPDVTTGDIYTGCQLHEMALYRVSLDGLNILSVTPLFTKIENIENHVQPISRGGTGANTASAALSNLHGVGMTTSDLTYYISPSGSDSNNGTSAASPFKTLAYALSQIPRYIAHTVTINVAAGTYNEACEITGFCGSGTIIIEGNSSSPNQYIFKNSISVTGNHCFTRIRGITAEKGVAARRCSAYVVVNDCVIGNDSSRTEHGFFAHYAFGDCSNCTIKNVDFTVQCSVGALCYSDNNTISNCSYAFCASSGIITRYRLNGSPTAAMNIRGAGGLIVGATGADIGN